MLRHVRRLGYKSTIITSFSIIHMVIPSFTLKLPLFSIYKLIEDHNDLFFLELARSSATCTCYQADDLSSLPRIYMTEGEK